MRKITEVLRLDVAGTSRRDIARAVVLAEWQSATRENDRAITHQSRALRTAEHRLRTVLGTLCPWP